LSIIDGHAQRLIKLRNRLASEEISGRADKIRAAVLRLTHLIENLLDSSRVIDGGLSFHKEEIDIAKLLHEVCQLHRELAPGSQIEERLGATPLQIVGDPKLLFQMFSNLLSNAIKYSSSGQVIEVAAEHDRGAALITVKDHGIGIPEKDIDQVFERYYRGSNVSGLVGTGVGLYLAKMVVEAHGGEITVASREGEGSTFTVRLLASAGTTTEAPSVQPQAAPAA
jgi:two-component system OmpR family sensor kinase